jgi:hypothetical protein
MCEIISLIRKRENEVDKKGKKSLQMSGICNTKIKRKFINNIS